MDTYGSGYTWASVLINDVYGTGASGYAILSPFSNGHGFDAPNELNAKTVCLYTVMKKDDILEDLIESKYHQYGLLKNPIFLNNNLKANAAEKMLDIVVKIDNSVTFDSLSLGDIVIEQSTNTRHRIIHKITDGSLILHLQQLSFIYRNIGKSFFKENDDLISFNVDEIVSLPSINKYSGKLFYVTNRKGFTVNNEQFLTIRSFITFSNEQE